MIGERFGRLVVLADTPRRADGKRRLLCRCDCGAEITTYRFLLKSGSSSSCGCKRAENSLRAHIKHGHNRHRSPSLTYKSWIAMLQRCYSVKHPAYTKYGGAGILVADRWKTFENFLADMGERKGGESIDRIDGTKGYEPGNCRWATSYQQGLNKRTTVFLEHEGSRLCISDWARRLGISKSTLARRVKRFPAGVALSMPVNEVKRRAGSRKGLAQS